MIFKTQLQKGNTFFSGNRIRAQLELCCLHNFFSPAIFLFIFDRLPAIYVCHDEIFHKRRMHLSISFIICTSNNKFNTKIKFQHCVSANTQHSVFSSNYINNNKQTYLFISPLSQMHTWNFKHSAFDSPTFGSFAEKINYQLMHCNEYNMVFRCKCLISLIAKLCTECAIKSNAKHSFHVIQASGSIEWHTVENGVNAYSKWMAHQIGKSFNWLKYSFMRSAICLSII